MNIPYYRNLEMNKIYEIFCDKENKLIINTNYIDLNNRKKKLKNIIKAKYRWLNDIEYNNFYKSIIQKEKDLYLKIKKKYISHRYRAKIIKLFYDGDIDNNNFISIDEFKILMIRFNISDQSKQLFKDADTNGDDDLSIDEFINFFTINNTLLEKLDEILEYKFEIKKRLDKRNILFKNFPGSPIKNFHGSYRPSLANLRSPNYIRKKIL